MSSMPEHVLLLIPTTSYKAHDLMDAAERLGVEIIVGSNRRHSWEEQSPGRALLLDFVEPQRPLSEIREFAARQPLRAVIGVDDETVVLASLASQTLGLPHNPADAIRVVRNKYATRQALAAAGLRGPRFKRFAVNGSPTEAAQQVVYPCVLKPMSLSASRGVLRADGANEFVEAFGRVTAILRDPDVKRLGGDHTHLLVEEYLPGEELAVEGLLDGGRLRVLALFDKPDPLEGPTFEETLYVTPSRQPEPLQAEVIAEIARGCRALGLREGPVHAELRLHDGRPWLLEVAPRTIGGLGSRALRFGADVSLEELILRHALGRDIDGLRLRDEASGVMMIPIPRRGTLGEIRGLEAARSEPEIEEVKITTARGSEVVPLPEGHRYLGFIFARAGSPAQVEQALRRSHAHLTIEIAG
jgi:biotin carboxylase